ncbi:MAG: DUF4214 domain-containing protein [Huintestinicola sp.]
MKLKKLKKIFASLTAAAMVLTTMALTPITVNAAEILSETGTHTFVTQTDDQGNTYVNPAINQYSTSLCYGSYYFEKDDVVEATITTSVQDTSGWKVGVLGFDGSWSGWGGVYSSEGVLTLTTTIGDVMAENSIENASELGGIALQVIGTAKGDVVSYSITVKEGTPPPTLEAYAYDFDAASGTVAAGSYGQPAKTAVGDGNTITSEILGGSFTVVAPYTSDKRPKLVLSDSSGTGDLNWIQVDPDVAVDGVAYFKKATALSAWTTAGGNADLTDVNMLFIAAQDAALTVKDVKLYSSVSNVKTYSVTIADSITNGTVTADKTSDVAEGDTVTLTAAPASGYELDTISVKNSAGEAVSTTKGTTNNIYTFKMPASDVTVNATFKKSAYKVTVSAATNGSVKADKTSANMGDTVTLTVTPDTGYELDTISVKTSAGKAVSAAAGANGKYTFTMPASDVTVSAAFKASTYKITVNTAENGSISADKTSAGMGTTVTLTVKADEDYQLDTITVKDSAGTVIETTAGKTEGTYTFKMPASNVTVTAAFTKIPTYSVTIDEAIVNGTVTADKTADIKAGETVTLTVTASEGYELTDIVVMNGNVEVSTSETAAGHTFVMPAGDVTVTATFAEQTTPSYTITIDPSIVNGTVTTKKLTVKENDVITLNVTPTARYEVDSVSVKDENGTDIAVTAGTDGTYTFTMPAANVTVTAAFKALPTYTVTIDSAIVNGTVKADKTADLIKGDTVTLTVTPADGYVFESLTVKDASGAAVNTTEEDDGTYTFVMPEADVTVSASFAEGADKEIKAFVERLYTKLLGRASDPKGKANHVERLKNGASAAEIAQIFVTSSELKNKKLTNREFVKRMYLTMLDRNPDAKGLNHWATALDNGCSYGYVLQGFSKSAEFTKLCQSYGIERGTYVSAENRDNNEYLTAYVSRMYTKALNRTYDIKGLNNHTGRYIAGTKDAKGIAHDFIFSTEFKNRNLTDDEFIDTLYAALFDRNPDAKGKANWQTRMKDGWTREQVFNGFTCSAEFKKLVASFGI